MMIMVIRRLITSTASPITRRNRGSVAPALPSTFLVYIDIIKTPVQIQSSSDYESSSSSVSAPAPVQADDDQVFDYISFPLMIILHCSHKTEQSSSLQQLIRTQDTRHHWARSIDDMYVSLPVDSSFCHHRSELVGSVYNFIPASI